MALGALVLLFALVQRSSKLEFREQRVGPDELHFTILSNLHTAILTNLKTTISSNDVWLYDMLLRRSFYSPTHPDLQRPLTEYRDTAMRLRKELQEIIHEEMVVLERLQSGLERFEHLDKPLTVPNDNKAP